MRIMYEPRIHAEDSMLVRAFGDEYVDYMRTTRGLLAWLVPAFEAVNQCGLTVE